MRRLGHALVLVAVVGVHPALAQDIEAPATPVATAVVAPREGLASWYGPFFHGRLTACGEVFDQHALTAAHRSLPFGTKIAVTNLETGCSVVLRVNDRGPYHGRRILDCSRAAAEALGFVDKGVTRIRWVVVPTGADAPPGVMPQEPARPTCMEDVS